MKLAKPGLGNVRRPQLTANIDFHPTGAEARNGRQRLTHGLPQATCLNSDFDGWHGCNVQMGASN
jgi:hypothetical protein